MQKHKPFGWIKDENQYRLIVRICDNIFQLDYVTFFKDGIQHCQFADGTPFGMEIEIEE